jgi:hypothetical protein
LGEEYRELSNSGGPRIQRINTCIFLPSRVPTD